MEAEQAGKVERMSTATSDGDVCVCILVSTMDEEVKIVGYQSKLSTGKEIERLLLRQAIWLQSIKNVEH